MLFIYCKVVYLSRKIRLLKLPIDAHLSEIALALSQSNSLVIVSPPGSGKTTRVPPFVAKQQQGQVVLLQPRRVAVRTSVERIAEEQQWQIGEEIGFQVRFERKGSGESQLMVMTEGVLSKRIQRDPELKGVSCVILDEFHERSLHTDFAVAWIRELQKKRPDLQLIVMSATMNAEAISRYLNDCPIVSSQGQIFPLELQYQSISHPWQDFRKWLPAFLNLVKQAKAELPEGSAMLVFLPGRGEIEKVRQGLKEGGVRSVYTLHGQQSFEEQREALKERPESRIVLCTNVAETSLTVPQVSAVVDSGLERVLTYNPVTGVEQLRLQRISQASADQRAGRAARLGPGHCYRMWTSAEHRKLKDYLPPEIHRVDLTEWILYLKNLDFADPENFNWFTPPKPEFVRDALQTLKLLRVIDVSDKITPLGEQIVGWPMPPRLGVFLVHSKWSDRFEEGLMAVSLLGERDILRNPPTSEETSDFDCDLSYRLDVYQERRQWSSRELNLGRVEAVARNIQQLKRRIRVNLPRYGPGVVSARLEERLFLAFPDRLCRRREKNRQKAKMFGGRGVVLDNSSAVKRGELFLALNPIEVGSLSQKESFVSLAAMIEPQWVRHHFADFVSSEIWTEERKGKEVKTYQADHFFDIAIENPRVSKLTAQEKLALEVKKWMADPGKIFQDHPDLQGWIWRVRLATQHFPDMDWPRYDDQEIQELLELFLAEAMETATELNGPSLLQAFKDWMSPLQWKFLESQVPTTYKWSNGRSRPIEYFENLNPMVSVKIQELFGQTEHPTILQGKCPLRLQLLAPNFKPVQITGDLASFWESTYVEVRKELKIRYHKHAWPEDPACAAPEFKGSYPKPK